MPEVDFGSQAEVLRRLLEADAVLYWGRENPSLAVSLGSAPAGLIETGFLPPASTGEIQLLQGKTARARLPLRLRALPGESGMVLIGNDGERGGILAVWREECSGLPRQAEAIMGFALAAIDSQLDLAHAYYDMERSQVRRMSGLADALPHGVILVPAGNRSGYLNHMAGTLLGLPHGPVDAGRLSTKLGELAQRAKNHEDVDPAVQSFIAGHGSVPLAGRVWRFDGSPSALRVTVTPIDPGHSAGWFWLLEDISAAEAEAEARERQRHLEWLNAELENRVGERTRQLEQANETLLRANEELAHYAHAMAHDLQTPLRSIAGFAQLLQGAVKRFGDTSLEEWAAQVVANTKRLQILIQGLLSYNRLEAEAAQAEEVDMNRLFDEVKGSLQALIKDTGAEVVRGELPVVAGGRSRIGQVLQNLIENGLKYNTSQPPRVTVSCRQEGDEWVFTVADNGMGIDPRHHERIFGIFKRLHAYDQIPGTGIGLALCRRIVASHGGRIWVDSEPGRGAAFHFTLPVRVTA